MAIRKDVANVLDELSKKSGINRGELSRRFHQIKSRGTTPGPGDVNWIDDISGDVYDGPGGRMGAYIGNVFNDF
jgi:hypothetical protein